VLEETIDAVECRWCRASGDAIEVRRAGESEAVAPGEA
jgi:hypothetical protein